MQILSLVRSQRAAILALVAAALVASHGPALADANGFPLCTASGDQILPVVASDGSGGAIIAWHDRRPTVAAAGVCFAQRVNAQGVALWTSDGVQLSTSGDVHPPVIVADGAGGAYVAFGGDASQARVQWVNAAGAIQWGADGTALTTNSSSQRDLAITLDVGGAGGVIVAWREANGSAGTSDIYAQKVNAAGTIQWSSAGSPVVATSMNSETLPALVSDNAGGAFVMWLGNGSRIQRIDAAGTPQWGNTPLSATANNRPPAIALDGTGGVITAWGGGGIFAQRVSALGNRMWDPANTGVPLSTLGNQVTLISDGAGGGILAWQENRTGTNLNLYAQKLSNSGATQWLATGLELMVTSGDQLAPMIVKDGSTGAIVTWYDLRNGATISDIYAQRIDADGTKVWEPDGEPLSLAALEQEFPTIAADGAGGAFVTWEDRRSGNHEDIYFAHVGSGGAVLDVTGEVAALSASRPWPHPFTDQVSFTMVLPSDMRLALDVFDVNGRKVRSVASRDLPAGRQTFAWDGRVDGGGAAPGGIYFLRVAGARLSVIRTVIRLR
jgi:predicted lipoprotein with Yx(FWY)xxD motif